MAEIHKLPDQITFDDFWKRYPRKVGKAIARAKWNQITGPGLKTRTLDRDSGQYVELDLQATPEEIMAGLKAWWNSIPMKADFTKDIDEQYIPHPATWLNRGRWEDYDAG